MKEIRIYCSQTRLKTFRELFFTNMSVILDEIV